MPTPPGLGRYRRQETTMPGTGLGRNFNGTGEKRMEFHHSENAFFLMDDFCVPVDWSCQNNECPSINGIFHVRSALGDRSDSSKYLDIPAGQT